MLIYAYEDIFFELLMYGGSQRGYDIQAVQRFWLW